MRTSKQIHLTNIVRSKIRLINRRDIHIMNFPVLGQFYPLNKVKIKCSLDINVQLKLYRDFNMSGRLKLKP